MKTAIIKQEILLMITPFSKRELCEKNAPKGFRYQSNAEQLEEACWNGMVQTRLPEIFLEASDGRDLFLWQIKEAESFLVLELGEAPTGVDSHSSIVPYLFASTQNHS